MAAGRIIIPNYMPALDINGNPVAGARLTFYQNKTTTLATTYTDATLSVPHPNPVIAGADGVFPAIFADTLPYFTVAITDASGAPIGGLRHLDDVQAAESMGAKTDLDGGNVPSVLAFFRNLFRFDVQPEHFVSRAQVPALRSAGMSASAAFTAAFASAAANGRKVKISGGSYLLSGVTIPENLTVRGAGQASTFIIPETAATSVFTLSSLSELSNLTIINANELANVEGVTIISENASTVGDVTFAGLRWNIRAAEGGNHRFSGLRSTSFGTQKAGAVWLGSTLMDDPGTDQDYGCVAAVMPNYRIEEGGVGVHSPAIYLRRAVAVEMPNLNANCPGEAGVCIQIDGDSQGINITGTIAGFDTQVEGTLGSDGKYPIFINLDGLDFDQFNVNAIRADGGEGWSWYGMCTSSAVATDATAFVFKGKAPRLVGNVSGYYSGGCALELEDTEGTAVDLQVRETDFGIRLKGTNTNLTGTLRLGSGVTYPIVTSTDLEFWPAGAGNNVRVYGYSFATKITTPAMPASNVGVVNNYGVACRVFVFDGAVNIVRIDGINQGFAPCTVLLQPGETITVDYSSTPSWSWAGI